MKLIILGSLCCATVLLATASWPQISKDLPGLTDDYVAAKGWWPTKATSHSSTFAGEDACAKCHLQQSSTHNAMAEAAFRLSGTAQSGEPASGRFDSGVYSYQFVAADPGFALEVKSGEQSTSSKIEWTFGAGVHGQTYLLEEKGQLYEAQVSSFSSTHQLNLTPGHTAALEGSLQNALGLRLSPREAARCFACHATNWSTDGRLDLIKARPGIHCEACHGPGAAHMDAVAKGQMDKVRQAIFDPGKLTPAKSIDLCGSCHRTTMDVVLSGVPNGVSGIRFQPYRLQKSRCWERTEDARLTCVACHNPHEPLVRDVSFYDRKCLSCHSAAANRAHDSPTHLSAGSAPVCPKAKANCINCHMPKYVLPEMHSQFTDHFIRIVRAGEVYPN